MITRKITEVFRGKVTAFALNLGMTTMRLLVGAWMGLSVAAIAATHIVEAGDSLWKIAEAHGTTVKALQESNNMESDLIRVGQTLKIPELKEEIFEESAAGTERADPALSEFLQLQVVLDRAGFSPGKIDGLDGRFTRQARRYCQQWNPQALEDKIAATSLIYFEPKWERFVNRELPGSGSSPDFEALSADKKPLLYCSMAEFLSERFHCSEKLLSSLNPDLDLEAIAPGVGIVVPNVVPFDIERYLTPDGEGQWSKLVGKGVKGRVIEVSMNERFLKLWEGERLLRAFPITVNEEKTPEGRHQVQGVVPGPVYYRKKTAWDLDAGPNSPVGVIWCALGDGYGIHGTNNPDSIGRATSSGCVRLANWDVVRLAGMIRKGTEVRIGSSALENSNGSHFLVEKN